MEQVGFIGLGLIGGSLAKALKKNGLARNIVAYDIDEASLLLAQEEGVVDICAPEIDESFKACDLIFLCCPVHVNIEAYKKLIGIVGKNCVIADVASTKQGVVEAILALDVPIPFIGGHPMAGSEKFGYSASKAHLFENAYYILTPLEGTDPTLIDMLYELVKGIKALPIVIAPKEHDHITAAISHVPHVIAASLVNMVKAMDSQEGYMHTLSAGGFKDITRIASSSPVMWQQICLTNKENIIQILKYFKGDLEKVIDAIEEGNQTTLFDFFESAREYRDSFQEKKPGGLLQTYAITVDVVDEPGIIAQIATLLSNHNISIKNIGIINNREHTSGVLEIVFYEEESIHLSTRILTAMNYIVYNR